MAAKEKEQLAHEAGVISMHESDLGASPQMSKGPIASKKQALGKMSPLA